MKFRTQFSERVKVFNPTGDFYRPDRKGVLDKSGALVVKEKSTKIDQYSYINSFREETDLNVLVARFRAGDKTALNQRQGFFVDISNMPDNINDLMRMHHEITEYFNTLPADIKSKYNNSVNVFIDKLGDPDLRIDLQKSPEDLQKEKSDLSAAATKALKQAADTKLTSNPGSELPKVEKEITPDLTGIGSVAEILKGAINK